MKGIIFGVLIILCGCTVSVQPLRPKKYYVVSSVHHHGKEKSGKVSSSEMTTVNGDWVERYREMEDKVHFRISEDAKITAEGDHFKVPRAVINHNEDLLKASPSPP